MKPVVLIFSGCYLPGLEGGGPIRTISNLVEALGDEFDFRIVTSDRDLNNKLPYSNIDVDSWNTVGKAEVFYASPEYISLQRIADLLSETPHDVLYLNSFFNVKFSLMPLLVSWLGLFPPKPVILAPRGEFSKSALAIKKWKKLPYLYMAMYIGLFRRVIWQASSDYERVDVERVVQRFGYDDIRVAENIASPTAAFPIVELYADDERGEYLKDSTLRICFLSRIVPVKNLAFALEVLAQVKVNVQFNIFGPKESMPYWNECSELIGKLPPHVQVSYLGLIEHSKVRQTIAAHDLFFVPSKGENFGHVFMESLSAGVPILVSDRTPWRGLAEKNIGWDISLDAMKEFVAAIDRFAQISRKERQEIKLACADFATKKAADDVTLAANRDLFICAVNGSIITARR